MTRRPDARPDPGTEAGPGALVRWWRRLGGSRAMRFASGVLGADKYERYLEYHRRSGCSGEPLSEREYWRELSAHQEANPQGRCC